MNADNYVPTNGDNCQEQARPCSKCGDPRDRIGQKYCLACHRLYQRQWRQTHPLTEVQRIKDRARSYAGVYERKGALIPTPCERCNAEKVEKHHPDYSKPLEIVWLCRPCHLALHREERHGR